MEQGRGGAALVAPLLTPQTGAPAASTRGELPALAAPMAAPKPPVPTWQELGGSRIKANPSGCCPPLHPFRNQSGIWEYLPLSLEMGASR